MEREKRKTSICGFVLSCFRGRERRRERERERERKREREIE